MSPGVDLPKRLRRGEFDLLFCGLIPCDDYHGLSYTRSYLDTGLVVVRQFGDSRITSDLRSLDGRTVAIIADPAARAALETCNIRPGDLRQVYDEDYFPPLADGVYDAFVIDLPVAYWSANDPASPWYRRIEIVGDPLTKWILLRRRARGGRERNASGRSRRRPRPPEGGAELPPARRARAGPRLRLEARRRRVHARRRLTSREASAPEVAEHGEHE